MFQLVYDVVKSVATALQELHQCDLVHGAVHPNNVLMNGNGDVVLAEYDFTKSAVGVNFICLYLNIFLEYFMFPERALKNASSLYYLCNAHEIKA